MTRWLSFSVCMCLLVAAVQAAEREVPVATVEAKEQEIYQSIQLTGTVTSLQTATLSVLTGGIVDRVYADLGHRVKQGDLLLELDADLVQLQLQNFMAKHEQAMVAFNDAKRRLEELRALSLKKSVSKSAVQSLEAEVAKSQAQLQQAIADKHYQKELLARHSLKAPFTGVISKKQTEKGEWLSPGDAVFELVAPDNVLVDFYVAEDYLKQINQQALVQLRLNVDPINIYSGKITAIVPVVDPVTRTFLLRIAVNDVNKVFAPGMSVSSIIQVPTKRKGIVVPKDALLRYPDGRVVVWAMTKDVNTWRVTERLIKTGVSFGAYIEVKKGLALGEKIVVRGNESLQQGQAVQPQTHLEL